MKKYSLRIISLVLLMSIFGAGCSKKLEDETLPSTEAATVPPVTEMETVPEITEVEETTLASEIEVTEETEPQLQFSTAVVTDRIVDLHGQLSVEGTTIVDCNGEPVQLKGMSTYGLNSMYGFINKDTVQTLAEDWGCDIIRLAMYTEGNSDGYIANPDKYFDQVCKFVDLCTDQGVYVIVDWHILNDGDPRIHKDEAIDFFSRISAIYADHPNVIYEICNEPNSRLSEEEIDWDNVIKPYAEEVIATIRANDPDNIIIVGTPTWSQDVDQAADNPIDDENVMYTVHFYAGSHGQSYRDKVQYAIDHGAAIFCTEWGTTNDSGAGLLNLEEAEAWLDFFDANNISWCNWSIGGAQTEQSNALKYNSKVLTTEEKIAGHWPDEFISDSGLFVRSKLLE